ncbi:MAG: hypothetical protein ACC641_07645 [Acidiferrobacterales bacterium]
MNQNIDSHKRHLAEQVLRGTEQSSLLRLNSWLLVAQRLAKIMGNTRIVMWLNAELQGYDNPDGNPLQVEFAARTGRRLDPASGIGDWRPFAEIEADNECDYRQNIAAKLQSLLHEFATDTYYTLEFGNQAESTFQFQRSAIDLSLVDFMGSALAKIPVLYDRLTRQDQDAVEPVLEICRQMIDTFSTVVTHRGKKPLLPHQIEAADSRARSDRIKKFIKQSCKDSRRVDRLTAAVTRQVTYLVSCNTQNTHPQEAKFLIMRTYMLLAEILALKSGGLTKT